MYHDLIHATISPIGYKDVNFHVGVDQKPAALHKNR